MLLEAKEEEASPDESEADPGSRRNAVLLNVDISVSSVCVERSGAEVVIGRPRCHWCYACRRDSCCPSSSTSNAEKKNCLQAFTLQSTW